MKIGKYISELLFTTDFVILPGFGEFSTKYVPARFVPEKKKVEAPSKVVAFNPKNKTDDNVLSNYIVKKENVSLEKAKEFLNNFVSEMNNSLKSGKKVELESIGQFTLAPNGDIEFTADKSINYLNDAAGLKSVKEPEKKSPEQAKTEVDKILDKADDAKKEASADKAAPGIPPKPGDKKEEDKDKKPLSATSPIQPIKEKSGLPPALKWVAFLVVPVVVIGVIVIVNIDYLFGDKAIDFKKIFDRKSEPVVVKPLERLTEDLDDIYETGEEITDIEPVEAKPSTPEPGRRVYYIIVGSFEEEHNAQIYADELARKGAVNARAFPRNPLGFYRVAYDFYYDLREAEQMLTTIQQTESQDAWILHR